jgi:hypothetical protein
MIRLVDIAGVIIRGLGTLGDAACVTIGELGRVDTIGVDIEDLLGFVGRCGVPL